MQETDDLYTKALEEFNKCSPQPSLRQIAKLMGNASHEWVRLFVARELPNPGLTRVRSFIAAVGKISDDK